MKTFQMNEESNQQILIKVYVQLEATRKKSSLRSYLTNLTFELQKLHRTESSGGLFLKS